MKITSKEKEMREHSDNGTKDDTLMWDMLEYHIKKYNVTKVYETGTYLGGSTVNFSELVDEVWTVEWLDWLCTFSKRHFSELSKTNIKLIHGSSADVFSQLLPLTRFEHDRVLFFLDAHGHHSPILKELAVIFANRDCAPPLIGIHDFFNPNLPDLAAGSHMVDDTQNRYRLDETLVTPALDEGYGKGKYTFNYPTGSSLARPGYSGPGSVLITPK